MTLEPFPTPQDYPPCVQVRCQGRTQSHRRSQNSDETGQRCLLLLSVRQSRDTQLVIFVRLSCHFGLHHLTQLRQTIRGTKTFFDYNSSTHHIIQNWQDPAASVACKKYDVWAPLAAYASKGFTTILDYWKWSRNRAGLKEEVWPKTFFRHTPETKIWSQFIAAILERY